MIDFPCRCGFRFSVPEDLAAGSVQCPQCGRLNDVPTLSDLPNINADGTYKDIPLAPVEEPDRMEQLERAFSKSKLDQQGEEIDLRPTMEDVRAAGTEEIPLQLRDELRPAAPRYDPETGELINPMDVKAVQPMAALPVEESAPKLSYARRAYAYDDDSVTWGMVPVRMFAPANLFAWVIVYLAHMVVAFLFLTLGSGLFFLAIPGLVLVALLLAHFGNVVDEIGRAERNELPGMLRHAGFREDIWDPFVGIMGALLICYLPYTILHYFLPGNLLLQLIAGLAGCVIYPAVLLTTVCGDTTRNLRPDRVLGVMRACGPRYWLIVLMAVVSWTVYGIGLEGAMVHAYSHGAFQRAVSTIAGIPIAWSYGILLVGLYLMHVFCWWVGLLYREHNEQFPWLFQRHISTRFLERVGKAPGGAGPKPQAQGQ